MDDISRPKPIERARGGVSDGIYAHMSVIKVNLQFEGNGCGLTCRSLRAGDKLPMNDRLCGGMLSWTLILRLRPNHRYAAVVADATDGDDD